MGSFPIIRNGRSLSIAAVRLPADLDPAAVFEDLFESNRWGDSWRDGIYVHYHSRIHEGIARGEGKGQFGGHRGRIVTMRAGDVAILPAGTGYQHLSASKEFLAIGAYPASGKYHECTSSEDHKRALKTIPNVGRPRKNPAYGAKDRSYERGHRGE
jgi:uncharacterized protein YjlB